MWRYLWCDGCCGVRWNEVLCVIVGNGWIDDSLLRKWSNVQRVELSSLANLGI